MKRTFDPERVTQVDHEFDPFRVGNSILHGIRWRRHRLLNLSAWRTRKTLDQILPLLLLLMFTLSSVSSLAQDARELQQERSASNKVRGEHPLVELMRTRKSTLRPELMGVHPRVYVTDKE